MERDRDRGKDRDRKREIYIFHISYKEIRKYNYVNSVYYLIVGQ